ncbi:hypothetical protein ACVWZ3_006570 [Bradyrhizobium sp. i1.3.6]
MLGFVVRLVVLPDPDPRQPYDRRLVVPGERNADTAAFAVDTAAEPDLGAVLGENSVVTGATGVEIAGAMAVSEAEPEGVVELLVLLVQFRRDQQLHRGDLLLRMPRQMCGIVAADEAGIGLAAGCPGIHARVEGFGLGLGRLADIVGLLGACGADEGGKDKRKEQGKPHDRTGRANH